MANERTTTDQAGPSPSRGSRAAGAGSTPSLSLARLTPGEDAPIAARASSRAMPFELDVVLRIGRVFALDTIEGALARASSIIVPATACAPAVSVAPR
jgi:hypothetical protein